MGQTFPFKRALITGASSGIGEELARYLAHQGVDLLITGQNEKALELLQQGAPSDCDCQVFVGNLKDQEKLHQLLGKVHSFIPDLMINCAGYGLYGDALTHPLEEEMGILQVNVEALTALSIEAARTLVRNKMKGVICNISSVAAFHPFPKFSVYAASKAYVNHFSESFDYEMRPYGVRVFASCPGQVASRFRRRATDGASKQIAGGTVMSVPFAAKEIIDQILRKEQTYYFDSSYRWMIKIMKYLIPNTLRKKILARRIEAISPGREILTSPFGNKET